MGNPHSPLPQAKDLDVTLGSHPRPLRFPLSPPPNSVHQSFISFPFQEGLELVLTTYLGRPLNTHCSLGHHPQADSMSLSVWPSVTL